MSVIKAKTVSLYYEPSGSPTLRTGIKQGYGCYNGNDLYINGRKAVSGGFGTYLVLGASSKFILTVEIDEEKHDILVGRVLKYFADTKRLTVKWEQTFKQTMPKQVQVEKFVSKKGRVYYKLTSECAREWAKQAKSIHN